MRRKQIRNCQIALAATRRALTVCLLGVLASFGGVEQGIITWGRRLPQAALFSIAAAGLGTLAGAIDIHIQHLNNTGRRSRA